MAILHLTSENFDETINNNGNVIIDFWAPWCGPCKMLAPVLDEIDTEMNGKVVICKVNVDEAQDLAEKFKVMTIPTVMYFKNGKEANKKIGFMKKQEILDMI